MDAAAPTLFAFTSYINDALSAERQKCTERSVLRARFQPMHLIDKTSAVLVVDDEFLLRMSAVDSILAEGLSTLEAEAASEALTLLNAHPEVQVLFTDINIMGCVNGLELAREVSQLRPDVRVIITSGNVHPSLAEMPANSIFVPKPYQIDHVARIIGQLARNGTLTS